MKVSNPRHLEACFGRCRHVKMKWQYGRWDSDTIVTFIAEWHISTTSDNATIRRCCDTVSFESYYISHTHTHTHPFTHHPHLPTHPMHFHACMYTKHTQLPHIILNVSLHGPWVVQLSSPPSPSRVLVCSHHVGFTYDVVEPKQTKFRLKSYGENFSWDKRTRVTSK